MEGIDNTKVEETKEKLPSSEKEVARKRVFLHLLGICIVILAFIIWEIVDIALYK